MEPESKMRRIVSWVEILLLSVATLLWIDCIRLRNDKVLSCILQNEERNETVFDLGMDISQLNLRLKTLRWHRVLFKSEEEKYSKLLDMKEKLLSQISTLSEANREAERRDIG
ncbi:uncharacterized protein LOC122260774 isoform X2 [Penaeus japonicus]|uniref:uncharacterized protein LOC122260774 isoform X2 n=1 Tax=Penaeus japonicus TaxID=27405 RepID=UPI001C70F81B|nr:uncharacterized protein LOC122260774 isoform X2 [Penaeus japonicus]